MGRHFAFSMLKGILAQKSTPPTVVTNMSLAFLVLLSIDHFKFKRAPHNPPSPCSTKLMIGKTAPNLHEICMNLNRN